MIVRVVFSGFSAVLLVAAVLASPSSVQISHDPDFSVPVVSKKEASLAPITIISPYDDIIQKHAWDHGIDWRLVTSIIWTESRFKANAVSPAGAMGLMQIMPVVAMEQGVESAHEPEQNVRAGIRHFLASRSRIRGQSEEDTLKLSLAAYNAGLGHLRDAQRLCVRFGKNPRSWKDVRGMLLNLEIPQYYRTARHGYCKGSETVEYVDRVLGQYKNYRGAFPLKAPTFSQAPRPKNESPA